MTNTVVTPLAFKDQSFFAEVREKMKMGGLSLFSQVSISHEDAKSRLPSSLARVTSQFYWLPTKQLIIQLEYNKNTNWQADSPTHISAHWSIMAYIGFIRSAETLEELSPNHELSGVPYLNGCPDEDSPSGFRPSGWSYSGMEKIVTVSLCENDFRVVSIETVVSAACSIKGQVEKYIRSGQFAELWVHSFPPAYVFPGCEEIFWNRFDKRNLFALVNKPHGSKGLRR